MFENYPTYLVPDTNCFVDHLDGLKAIVACQSFTLVVPLIGKILMINFSFTWVRLGFFCQIVDYLSSVQKNFL